MNHPTARIALLTSFFALTACAQTRVEQNSLAAAKEVASAVGDVTMGTALKAAIGPTPLTPEQTAEDHQNCRTLERCDTALQAHIRRRKSADEYLHALETAESRERAAKLQADFAARKESGSEASIGDSLVVLDSEHAAPSLYQETALTLSSNQAPADTRATSN